MSPRTTLLLCFLVVVCEGIDLQAAGVAAEGLRPIFRPSSTALSLFFAGSTLGLLTGAVIGGRLADSIGRKRVLVTSVALFGLFSLGTPFVPDMPSLIAMRILTGLGLGGALPNVIALVSETSVAHARSARVAAVYAGAPFGGAVASTISLLAGPAHWESTFIVGGIAPLILVPIMIARLPESLAFLQWRHAVRSGAAALGESGPNDRAGNVGALFADGRATRTALLWASFFLGLLTLYLLLNWLPTLLLNAGIHSTQVAAAQIGFNLGGSIAAVLAGRLLEGRTRRATVLVVFTALPILLYALAMVPPRFLALFATVFVLGCAVLAAQAFFYATAPAIYPTAIRGLGVGTAIAVGRMGSVVGPLLGGLLTASGRSSSELLVSVVPLAIVGSLLSVVLAWKMGVDR